MSRYRFRAHRQASHAINLMRQDAYKDAKAAQERNSAEAQKANEVNKKKEVKEDGAVWIQKQMPHKDATKWMKPTKREKELNPHIYNPNAVLKSLKKKEVKEENLDEGGPGYVRRLSNQPMTRRGLDRAEKNEYMKDPEAYHKKPDVRFRMLRLTHGAKKGYAIWKKEQAKKEVKEEKSNSEKRRDSYLAHLEKKHPGFTGSPGHNKIQQAAQKHADRESARAATVRQHKSDIAMARHENKKKVVNELSHKTYQDYVDKATSYGEKEKVESEAEAANSRRKTTWKKAFARKLSRASGVKTATKKLKEDKEENEARERARREKNVKKWKQNTDRWAKWKAEQKEKKEVKEETDKDRYNNKSYKRSRDAAKVREHKSDIAMARHYNKNYDPATGKRREVKEDKFTLPDKYEGDHSVRNIYVDEAWGGSTYRGSSGRQMQVSAGRAAGGGLYGAVGDAPVRAAAARPAARQVAKPVAKPVARPAAAPVTHGKPQQAPAAAPPTPVRKPGAAQAPVSAPKPIVGQSNVPAGNVPSGSKFPAATPPYKGSSSSSLFNYAKPAAPSGTIQPGQAKSAGFNPGVKRPEIKAQVPAFKGAGGSTGPASYKPAATAVHGLSNAPRRAVQDISAPTSSLLGKSPEKTVSPIAKPGVPLSQTPSTAPRSDIGPSSSVAKTAPSTVPPAVSSSAPAKDIGPTNSLSATSPELKSILSKDAGPGQSSLTPGLKVTPTPLAAQRQTIRKKVQDIAGPTFEEKKFILTDKYGGSHSVRRIYDADNS